ncbi:MAG: 50S ribosomal protein L30 [Spirochaetes bacterium]|nr:50S ribosomal protein L30 [Spirochaetota bacterium]
MASTKKLRITLKKSLIGVPEKQRKVVRALGLRKRQHVVVQDDNPVINGMIFKVNHLVDVERVKK